MVDEHNEIQSELKPFGGKLIISGMGYAQELLEKKFIGLYERFCPNFKEITPALCQKIDVKRRDEGTVGMEDDE